MSTILHFVLPRLTGSEACDVVVFDGDLQYSANLSISIYSLITTVIHSLLFCWWSIWYSIIDWYWYRDVDEYSIHSVLCCCDCWLLSCDDAVYSVLFYGRHFILMMVFVLQMVFVHSGSILSLMLLLFRYISSLCTCLIVLLWPTFSDIRAFIVDGRHFNSVNSSVHCGDYGD